MNDYLRPSYFRNKEDAMELCKIAKSLNEAAITKVSSKTLSCHFLLFNGHFFNFPTVYNMCLSPITVII